MQFDETKVANAFGSPVFHLTETESTMQDARILAGQGYPSGTVAYADFQNAGRGRVEGRTWVSPPKESLLCTVLIHSAPPPGFTLRVGLAVARSLDAFLPADRKTRIKWPNDVLVGGKKIAGILCENDGSVLYVGTGINIGQDSFPADISAKATSLALGPKVRLPSPEEVLEVYLAKLREVLELKDWQTPISEKLLYRGERITFLAGDPGKDERIDGFIEGIGPAGELLFRPATAVPGAPGRKLDADGLLHLWSGEIPYPCEQ